MSFDAAGRLATETNALGQLTTHSYDASGRETARALFDGQAFSFAYDKRGAMLTTFDSTGLTTHTYDAVGRLKTVLGPDYPGSTPLTYAYDGMGNRIGLSGYFADGSGGYSGVFTYTYDERGQLASIDEPAAPVFGVPLLHTTFAYDALGRLSQQQNTDGSVSTYLYDAVGRTLQVQHANLDPGTSALIDGDHAFYQYDEVGRPQWLDTAWARHTYTYDAVDQLQSEEFSFTQFSDDNPNRQYQNTTFVKRRLLVSHCTPFRSEPVAAPKRCYFTSLFCALTSGMSVFPGVPACLFSLSR